MDVQYDGQNALRAAANGDFPLVVLLWGMAMAVQPQPPDMLAVADADGNTLLHHAAASAVDAPDTLHFLLQQMHARGDALIDSRNAAKETPLIRAAHAGNLRIVDALLTVGRASVLAKDAQGNTAAHHAASQGHLWVLHYLLEYERRMSPEGTPLAFFGGLCVNEDDVLHYACVNEHKAIVQYLLKRGYNPNRADAEGTTCLDIAQSKSVPWMVDYLSGEKSANEAPTSFRQTRVGYALFYALMMFKILATSHIFPWWLSLPLILFALMKSLAGFKGHGKGHGGHSHGGAAKNLENVHPSKRDVVVAPSVSLVKTHAGANASSKKTSCSPLKKIRFLIKNPQPEAPMGIWLAWVMFFTMFYIVMWAANDYATIADKYQVFLIILGVFHVIMLAVWLRLAVLYPSDPGTITSFHDDIDGLLEDATRGIPLDPVTHCRTCLVLKPMRSKHCNKCGVCIARLDHHCTWINRCVGYGNHRIFVVFLLLHVTVLLGYVSLALIVSYEQIRIMHDERVEEYAVRSNSTSIDVTSTSMSSLDVWIEIPGLISGYLIVLIVLIWAMLAAGALGLMAKQHIGNMFTNLTVNEQINWRRYSYLTKQTNGPFSKPVTSKSIVLSNPFDRSAMHNLKEFWTRSGRDAVDYRKVFSAPTEKGFATVPEAHRAESKEVHFSGVQAV